MSSAQEKKLSRRSCFIQVHHYDKLVLPIVVFVQRLKMNTRMYVFREQEGKKLITVNILYPVCCSYVWIPIPNIMKLNGSYVKIDISEFRVNLSKGNAMYVC